MRFQRIARFAAGISVAACSISLAHAQSMPATPDQAPSGEAAPGEANEPGVEIIVTGTNIRGTKVVGNSVLRVTSQDMLDSGRSTVADFLRELPSNFAGGVGMSDNAQGGQDASSAGSNLTGGQGVNLRGLGALSTLVLVNGRRVAASGQYGDFVDISTIPSTAIERIEVLQDGASAVYGSDAVGGVVNLILKDHDDGLHTTLRLGTTTQGGGSEALLGGSYGTSWSGGHLFAAYEYYHRDRVRADQRAIYNGGDFSDRGGINWPQYTARAGTAANIFSGTAAANGTVIATVPQGSNDALSASDLTTVSDGVGNTYNPWANVDVLPRVRRHSFYLAAEQELSDALTLSGDLRYTWRKTDYNSGYAVYYGTVPSTSPYYIDGSSNNFGVVIDDEGLVRKARVDSFAAHLALDAELGSGWHARFDGSYSREVQSRYATMLRNTNIMEHTASGAYAPNSITCALSGLNSSNIGALSSPSEAQSYCAGLDYETWNPYSTEALSQAVLDELIGYEDLRYVSQLVQFTAKADGTLFPLPAGDVKVAIGADYRREQIGGALSFNYRSTDDEYIQYGTTRRQVGALFGELSVPLIAPDMNVPGVRSLDLSSAVRYEHGTGLGAFDTVNPKFGLDYVPFDGLRVHGSFGTSFHAPPMRYMYDGVQPTTGGNGAFLRTNLYTAPCDTDLVALNGVSGTPGGSGNCTFTAIVVSGGAGDSLKPERATTWTLGADLEPPMIPGLKLSASYFNIRIKDRITRIQSGTLGSILASYFATGSSPYSAALDFDPDEATVEALFDDPRYLGQLDSGPTQSASDVAAIIYATQVNLAELRMDGFDVSASYRLETAGAGTFDAFFSGTRLLSYKIQAAPGSGFIDQLGKYSSTGNPVKFRSKQGLGWRYGPWSVRGTVNFTSSYECESGCYVPDASTGAPVLATSPVPIGSWTTLDLNIGLKLGGIARALADSSLAFSVVNLFDADPPFIDSGTAVNDTMADPYDAANATAIGRTVSLTFHKDF
ncbi:TonB-dependent receptor [Novosphingobium sp. 1949]|uniref:TonB-dependent receptor n=1 Tax=Novosphingobium organovorum TaxID=2930092 RepID=A0ABT0BGU2_9SPHN|nr:TonB-dependent receptor [Novosphingobium organovorum]MCJ2184273.1 TonB-dependent receptor [Novosphingobium organovorum]